MGCVSSKPVKKNDRDQVREGVVIASLKIDSLESNEKTKNEIESNLDPVTAAVVAELNTPEQIKIENPPLEKSNPDVKTKLESFQRHNLIDKPGEEREMRLLEVQIKQEEKSLISELKSKLEEAERKNKSLEARLESIAKENELKENLINQVNDELSKVLVEEKKRQSSEITQEYLTVETKSFNEWTTSKEFTELSSKTTKLEIELDKTKKEKNDLIRKLNERENLKNNQTLELEQLLKEREKKTEEKFVKQIETLTKEANEKLKKEKENFSIEFKSLNEQFKQSCERVIKLEKEKSVLIEEKSQIERKLVDSSSTGKTQENILIEKEKHAKETVERYQKEKNELVAEFISVTKQLNETKEKMSKLEEDRIFLISEKNKLEKKCNEFENIAKLSQKTVIEKEKIIKETTERFTKEKNELINQITMVTNQFNDANSKVIKLEREKTNLVEEKIKIEKVLVEKESLIIETESKFKHKLETSLKESNEKFQREKNEILNEIKTFEKKLIESNENYSKLESEKISYQEEKIKLETKLRETEKSSNTNEKTIKDKFNSDLKELEIMNAKLLKENADLISQLKSLQKKLNDSSNVINTIENEKSILKLEKDSAEMNVKKLEARLKLAEKENEDLKKRNLNQDQNFLAYRPVLYPEFNEKHLITIVKKKEEEINFLNEKLFVEQTELGRVTRLSDHLTGELKDVKLELTKEKNSRLKAEKDRNEYSRKIDDLTKDIERASLAQAILNETRIKSENEIFKLKQELEITNRKHDLSINQLKFDHEEVITKLNVKIEQLNKKVSRLEKEKF